jgi:hypothetical protein
LESREHYEGLIEEIDDKCEQENLILIKDQYLTKALFMGGNMANIVRPEGKQVKRFRKSLRLTFRVANDEVRLVSYERLNMICPPSVGDRPEAGKHGGFWMELRDADDRVLFHRLIYSPLGNSVEIHSPDGKIHREFGDVKENIFEFFFRTTPVPNPSR